MMNKCVDLPLNVFKDQWVFFLSHNVKSLKFKKIIAFVQQKAQQKFLWSSLSFRFKNVVPMIKNFKIRGKPHLAKLGFRLHEIVYNNNDHNFSIILHACHTRSLVTMKWTNSEPKVELSMILRDGLVEPRRQQVNGPTTTTEALRSRRWISKQSVALLF